jgi:3-oxoacyl-[acyl-carrier protein] reductase
MDINLTGTIFCCQAAAPYMQAARSGKIVNVASQAGLWSGRNSGGVAYKVAKAGVIHYTRVLAAELGPHNIHVNSIAPGYVLSSRAVAGGRNSPEVRDRLLQDIPLGRLGMPEDCAKVVEFLVTDLSDYVTGQCIPVCGGYVAF